MHAQIRIDFAHIDHFYQDDQNLERKAQILMRRNAIYAYRNQLLTSQLEESIHNDCFMRTEHGKPYLKSLHKLSLNHSHSQHFYVLATSTDIVDLGVDIEELQRNVRFDALAKHAFHPKEYQIWMDLECDPRYWFRVWTTKEAILKASGLGIRMSMNELNTDLHPFHHTGRYVHEVLGTFHYQNYFIQSCAVSISWRVDEHVITQFDQAEVKPKIEIVQH